MAEVVKTNEYRVLTMCGNCPFKDNGKAIHLDQNRVNEIKALLKSSPMESFNCHKTVYNLDIDMQPGNPQELKMCAGAYEYLKSINQPNMQMCLAQALGIDD